MNNPKGKIGIFDSGLGGLTILKKITKLMPNREYIYLGDNLNTPYGNKTQKQIFNLTLSGTEWLFAQGSEIVILACNTASSNALRRIQQEILPKKYPKKNVLGIVIPTVEEMDKFSQSGHIGVLATKATVASKVFEKEMKKQNPKTIVIAETGGDLAKIIENGEDKKILLEEINKVTQKLIARDSLIDTLVLGCTHYALIEKEIKQCLPSSIKVIGQGRVVAKKLSAYLDRHPEREKLLSKNSSLIFYTTSPDKKTKALMKKFYRQKGCLDIRFRQSKNTRKVL